MALLDIRLPKSIAKALSIPPNSPERQQIRVLKELLKKAKETRFGLHYNFSAILEDKNPTSKFQKAVKAYDYSTLYADWWNLTLAGEENVCWPGKIKYFALS